MSSGDKIVEAMRAAAVCQLAHAERYAVARVWRKGPGTQYHDADVYVVPWPIPDGYWFERLDGPFFTLTEAQEACRARMIPKAAVA